MPNLSERLPENAVGAFYVDASCIDCSICRDTAPAFFTRHDELGLSVVYRQPVTPAEASLAQEALEGCPSNSIGNAGDRL